MKNKGNKSISYSELMHLYKQEHKKVCRLERLLHNGQIEHITANEAYDKSFSEALTNAYAKIQEAVDEGDTSCYITVSQGRPNRKVIQTLLDKGYDIAYQHFSHDNDWFVQAFWSETSGKLIKCDLIDGSKESTIEEMYAETSFNIH